MSNTLFDIIIFDPPFWPYKQAYKQIREGFTTHTLEPIQCPTPNQYPQWWDQVCKISASYLKPSGWFCYKADSWTAKLTFPITTQSFEYSNEVIWDKCRIGLGRRIRTQHEQIECYTSSSKEKKYWRDTMFNQEYLNHTSLNDEPVSVNINNRRWHGSSKGIAFPSILRIPNYNNGTLGMAKKTEHINQTPPALWYNFLEYMCPPDGNVLDLCMGSGSIGQAVLYLNKHGASRSYCGIEISPTEFRKAQRNLQPTTILTTLLKSGNPAH